MLINGIVAMDKNRGIGFNNHLPWTLKKDLDRFQKITIGSGNNAIIIGKNTWNSIKFLKKRDHLILSTTLTLDYEQNGQQIKSFSDIRELIQFAENKKYDQVWVIGGTQIYKKCLDLNLITNMYITMINEIYECDTFFPIFPNNYFKVQNLLLDEITNNNNKTYMVIYKRLMEGMSVYHNGDVYIVQKIHYEDYPNYYFTIKDSHGNEKQTIQSKLKIKL
jgi:dihydrofolate reductase